jgi:serine acetyltransferase
LRLSHAYLTVEAPVDRDVSTALRVIDEQVWPTLRCETAERDQLGPATRGDHQRGIVAVEQLQIGDGSGWPSG